MRHPASLQAVAQDMITQGWPEAKRLRMLELIYARDPERVRDREDRHGKIADMRALFACAEDGKVAVIESGMDCDCVQYDGRVHIIDATPAAYRRLWDETSEWADGPFYFRIEQPSVAKSVTYRSRDRALEAYENGRPHVVQWGSL